MTRKSLKSGIILSVVLAGGIGIWVAKEWQTSRPKGSEESSNFAEKAEEFQRSAANNSGQDLPDTILSGRPEEFPDGDLPDYRVWTDSFRQVPVSERSLWLKRWWAEAAKKIPENRIKEWLIGFLESGQDSDTGDLFRVGPGGFLETAPTLRVQVLDWLGAYDPQLAAVQARVILDAMESPEEVAVALRNYGRMLINPSEDVYFCNRTSALISNPDWQASPTRGYLEGFDAAVYGGTATFASLLLETSLDAVHPGTRQAATMALDNIAGDDPLSVAEVINQKSSPIGAIPTFRAALVSRLDPRHSSHVKELRYYLLEVSHGPGELEVFAESFPNTNEFASFYLLTEQPVRSLYEIAQIDLSAYQLVRSWLSDPQFASRAGTLVEIESRLGKYLNSAVRGGFLEEADLQ